MRSSKKRCAPLPLVSQPPRTWSAFIAPAACVAPSSAKPKMSLHISDPRAAAWRLFDASMPDTTTKQYSGNRH
jgi:hypothetical protein